MKENIEEAIDRLEYVNRAYDCNNYYSRYDLDCIEILLSDYKRVLEINEVLLKENEELKADNYELNNRITDLLENIPIQTIEDKIEALSKTKGDLATHIAVSERIRALQELLEESEEN